MSIAPSTAKSNIRYIAEQLGFDDCRIAAATRAPHADDYLQWVEEGKAGDMAWLERNLERRCDPREVLPGARAVVCLAMNYFPGEMSGCCGSQQSVAAAPTGRGSPEPEPNYRIARYAWNDDYHDIIEDKLKDLDLAMQEMGGTQRYYTDTGPVLERDFASASGLGWNGKSTVQIHTQLGTWFFLAELITTLPLPPDPAAKRPLRQVHGLHDGLPDRGHPAPAFRRCPPLHFLPHHRAQGQHPGRTPPPHRRPHLWL